MPFLQNLYNLTQQYQYMSVVLGWQRLAFHKNLRVLLSHIAGSALNFLEFQLVIRQGNILFWSKDDEKRCRVLFEKEMQLLKSEIMELVWLQEVRVVHASQQFIVRFKKSKEQILHSRAKCFHFWKMRMEQRYGHVHEWFGALCQERDARRISLSKFIFHLERVLQGTLHSQCAKMVGLSFQKTKKNEIQLSVFMNTILIQTKISIRELSTRRERAKSAAVCSNTKEKQYRYEQEAMKEAKDISTAAGSTNKGGFQSFRDIFPKRSVTKYLTPKVKMKQYSSFMLPE